MANATPTSVPFDWVRSLSHALMELDEVPLLGSPPPFPWERLSENISKTFELSDFAITPAEWRWRSAEELLSGLGQPLRVTTLSAAPLNGQLWWLMSEEDWSRLMSWLLTKSANPLPLQQEEYREAFYRFALLEAIHQFQHLGSSGSISPSLTNGKEAPQGEALCLDVNVRFQQQTLWGRLVLSPEVRREWKEFNMKEKARKPFAIAQDIQVTVSLEGGKVAMTLDQWHKVSEGDFVILDSCTVDPTAEKQRVILSVNGKPVLRGRIKKNKLKISEYPLTQEVDSAMADDIHEEEDEAAEGEDLGEFEDLEEEFHEEFEGEGEHPEHPTEESGIEDSHVEDSQVEQESVEEEVAEKGSAPTSQPTAAAAPKEAIGANEITVTVTVEVARLKMTAQTLMHLQPGNLLDLQVYPEQGVNLTVNGKLIGHGELLKVGETLGVRVLDLH